VPADKVAELTAATLDLSVALGRDLNQTAFLLANTIKGDNAELGKFGINLENTLGRSERAQRILDQIAARGWQGQAAASLRAIGGPEMAAYQIAARDAAKATGELVLKLSAPFLAAFSNGLKDMAEWLKNFRAEHPAIIAFLSDFSAWLGKLAASNFAWLITSTAGIIALKAACAGLLLVLNPLRGAFVFFAGTGFLAVLGNIQAGTQLLGFWRGSALAATQAGGLLAGTMTVLATAAAVAGAAFAGWTPGSFIGELDAGGIKVKEWVNAVWLVLLGWWENTKSAFTNLGTHVTFTIRAWTAAARILFYEFVIHAAEVLNKVLPKTLQIATTGLAKKLAAADRELLSAEGDKTRALAAEAKELKARLQALNDPSNALFDAAYKLEPGAAKSPAKMTPPTAPITLPSTVADLDSDALIKIRARASERSYQARLISLDDYLQKRRELIQRKFGPQEARLMSDVKKLFAELGTLPAGAQAEQAAKIKELNQKLVELRAAHEDALAELETSGASAKNSPPNPPPAPHAA